MRYIIFVLAVWHCSCASFTEKNKRSPDNFIATIYDYKFFNEPKDCATNNMLLGSVREFNQISGQPKTKRILRGREAIKHIGCDRSGLNCKPRWSDVYITTKPQLKTNRYIRNTNSQRKSFCVSKSFRQASELRMQKIKNRIYGDPLSSANTNERNAGLYRFTFKKEQCKT